MEVLDKFFKKYSYKFDKGYPDMNNEQDTLLLESILRKLNFDISINEGTKASNTRKAIDIIINSKEGKESGLTKMTNAYRIGNKNKIDKDKFIEVINVLFNSPKLKIHGPKEGPNKSSKYSMFEFDLEDEGLVQIVLAGGANEGEKYEQNLLGKMQASAGVSMDEIEHEDVKKIFSTMGIDPTTITSDKINFAGASDTSRQLSFDGPEDTGKTISDITIESPDQTYYLSIKNKSGSAIYNGGNVPFIVYNDEGKVIFDESKYNEKPLFREIFETLNIDNQRVADGLNDYIEQTGTPTSWESAEGIDLAKVKKLLASSFGYNYWYVREKSGGKIFVHYIDGPQGAYDMIGDLRANSIKIKYPGKSTKVLEVRIETDSKVLEGGPRVPLVYQIVARNAAGKILPLRMNIRTNK